MTFVQRRAPRLALAAIALAWSCGTAFAQDKTKVSVLPFTGPQAIKAQAEVVRTLRKTAEIVPQTEWNETAKRLFATSKSADDIAAVANDLHVQVVITGIVKREGSWILSVSVRSGPTGKSSEKLRYPLRGPRIDASTLGRLGEEIGPAVDRAAVVARVTPEGAATNADGTPAARSIEDENPLAKKAEAKDETKIERPSWTPWFDASVGLVLAGRHFAFDQPGSTQFRSSVAAGLRIDATAYPLALLANRPGDTINGITGLGVGMTLDYMFWPDSIPCNRDINGNCPPTTERYSTREYRLETGLRYHWNFLNKPLRPDLLFSFQYGIHTFGISKTATGTDVGPPDVGYSYLTLGVGARIPFTEWIGGLINFNFHGLLDAGPIQSATEYGPGGGYGIRLGLGVEARPWKGLTIRALGFYERFGLTFNGAAAMPVPAKMTTGGAADQYYGFLLTAGYVY